MIYFNFIMLGLFSTIDRIYTYCFVSWISLGFYVNFYNEIIFMATFYCVSWLIALYTLPYAPLFMYWVNV